MRAAHLTRRSASITLLVTLHALTGHDLHAQREQDYVSADSLVAAARAIMESARYCALITLDETGNPRVRAMDPFAPEPDLSVWLGTHRRTRKVSDIRNDPRVALYYLAPGAVGYVSLTGTARIVDDPGEAARRWKEEWEQYYADPEADYVLIEVTPLRLEVVDYRLGITGDSTTWMPPSVEFHPARSKR